LIHFYKRRKNIPVTEAQYYGELFSS